MEVLGRAYLCVRGRLGDWAPQAPTEEDLKVLSSENTTCPHTAFTKLNLFSDKNISVAGGGASTPSPDPPTRAMAAGRVFKIIFQDFGKIILKHNLEKKSRLFFKILAKIFLNKTLILPSTYTGARSAPL